MKIVIDISEEDYNNIEPFLKGETINGGFNLFKVLEIIKKGTPLPEYHGDLIDRNEVLDDIVKQNPAWVSETDKRKRYARLVYYWTVKNAPTIIKGSEEGEK